MKLPAITALKLSDYEWRAASIDDEAARTSLATCGFHWQRQLADGSALYLRMPTIQDATPSALAAEIYASLIAAEQAANKPLAAVKFMAIVNLSPDSFSDGGTFQESNEALLAHCKQLITDQAEIFDLGAESTRPGAEAIDDQTQIKLLDNAMQVLGPLGIPFSIDTRSAVVAEHCLAKGAAMINDVSALSDPQMAAVIAKHNAQVVLMHSRGTSKTMQGMCDYKYLIGEICDELAPRINLALEAGISPQNIIIDPGIGFAKDSVQNFEIIKSLKAFRSLGFPVLAGPSRKSFISKVLPDLAANERDGASAGAASVCAFNGAEYLRLHCGGTNWDAVKIAQACS